MPEHIAENRGGGNADRAFKSILVHIDSAGKVTLRYAGKLRHLGTGRHNIGKRVIMLVNDADVTIIEMTTGEILGDYTIDPNRNYQPKKKQP